MSATDDPSSQPQRPSAVRRPLRPKDAATLILVDDLGGAPRVLMGKRRDDLVFMPGKYVFPGGRVDPADRHQHAADELRPDVEAMVLQRMKGRPSPARARALALAAVREVFEETGIVLGRPAEVAARVDSGTTASPRAAATWSAFEATGHKPALAPLTLLARAITPPGRPRRFDTRFFLASADCIALTTPHRDEELSHVDWFTLDHVRALDLPNITRAIVEELGQRIAGRGSTQCDAPASPIPFYFFQTGAFRRQMLAADGSASEPVVWRR